MIFGRRRLFAAPGGLAVPASAVNLANGQEALPDKTIQIFIGFEPGGGVDSIANAIAAQLERRLGRHVAVESRTGSFGALPGDVVRKGPADGSQLALLSSTTLIARLASKDFPYDPVNDLAPLTEVGAFAISFAVSPTIGVESFADYIQWLKSGDKRRRRIAVSSNTAFVRVLDTLLAQSLGEPLEPVPYRGAVPMLNDLQEGRIAAGITAVTALLPAHRGGRCRILFVSGNKRLAVAPTIPTALELGYSRLDFEEWFAFFAARATPPAIVAAWNRTLRAAIEDPSVAGELSPLGLNVETTTPDALAAHIAAHIQEWEARMKSAGLQPA